MWLSEEKLIIRLFCTLFSSFPSSAFQRHLCGDVSEEERERENQGEGKKAAHKADVPSDCIHVFD